MKISIQNHTTLNKLFEVRMGEVRLRVDYDDVNHSEVDATIKQLKEIIEKHWDDEKHREYFKQELMRIWNENKYGLQGDYDEEGGLAGYLANYDFTV